jgi:hypothetical protein
VRQGVQGAHTILQPVHGIALGLEGDADTLAQGDIIFHQQNAHLIPFYCGLQSFS